MAPLLLDRQRPHRLEMIFYEKPTVLVYESPTLVREMAALGKSGRS
jgi:hypothetical protein